ncbi:tyrosine-type recombinase/integrase [Kitasatospora sp. NA04385]|uniref:tyrosine-type recombinase/integrase n=1 Tax=Kitasatospora sp. NA04385 TaxID=2742135 RepID=UPI0034CEFFC3
MDPTAGKVLFKDFSAQWVAERGLFPLTVELYQRLLRLHILPTFAELPLNEITPAAVRTWHAKKKATTGATTVAKSYRLLKAIMQTAADDEAIPRNPCQIKGAGEEHPDERPVATVAQVFELAEYMGPRWRLMVFLGAFASLRPEELAALRRRDVDVDKRILRITEAAPELNSGQRVTGETKSRAGKRRVHLPPFLDTPLRQHMAWFAEEGLEGYLFVGERGGRLRGSTFGRKFRKARAKVGRSAQNPFKPHEFTRKERRDLSALPAADVPVGEILKGFDEQGLAELVEEEEPVEQKERRDLSALPATDVPVGEILKGFDEQGLAELVEEEEPVEQKERRDLSALPATDVPVGEILKGFDEQGLAELVEEEEPVEQVEPLPENFTFYDLRGTGNNLLAEEGASLKDLMVRMGHSSVRAAMIYQHSTERRQRELAAKMESRVRHDMGTQQPQPPRPGPPHGTSGPMATVHPIRRRA